MPATNVNPSVTGPALNGEVATGCAVCPHPWPAHDRIAARYCTATVAGKYARGCVCTAYQDEENP